MDTNDLDDKVAVQNSLVLRTLVMVVTKDGDVRSSNEKGQKNLFSKQAHSPLH